MSNEYKDNSRALASQAKPLPPVLAKLAEAEKNMARLCPANIDNGSLIANARRAIMENPAILNCTPQSVYECVATATYLGLSLNVPGLNHAWIIPYTPKATLIIGAEGFTQLIYRTGIVDTIEAKAVYEDDHFVADPDPDKFEYRINMKGRRGDEFLIGSFARVKLKSGGTIIEIMPREDVEAIEARSRAGSGPWKTDKAMMYRKSAIRRIKRYLPLSTSGRDFSAFALAAEADGLSEAGKPLTPIYQVIESAPTQIVDVTPAPEASGVPRDRAAVNAAIVAKAGNDEALKAILRPLKADKVEQLTDDEARELLARMENL